MKRQAKIVIMHRFWLVLTIVLLLSSACKAQNKGQNFNWKEFVSVEGKFKVSFPDVPKKFNHEINEKLGKRQSYSFEVSFPQTGFAVTYQDLPNLPAMNQDSLKLLQDNLREKSLKETNSKLISERNIWLDGKLGRETVVKINNQILIHRMYFTGNRQFQIVTSIDSSLSTNEEIINAVNKFLDSFQLIEK